MDIVTADGQLRTASATEHPDLFWAVRGGGGNFGVVTSFQYQLHPVGLVLAGQVFYPFKKAKAFLTFYRDFSRDIPDELNTIGGLATFPEVGPVAAAIVCYNGPVEEGEKVLRPLREFGSPLGDAIRPMPYTEIHQITGPMLQTGRRNYIKSIMVKDIGAAVIDTLVEYFARVPSPFTLLVFQQLGNAANRVGKDATAFNHRDAGYELIMHAIWLDQGDDEKNVRWTRELAATTLPLTGGSDYINQMGTAAEEGADRIRAAFGPNYQRLVAVKQKYDPTNLFRHNQNIKPAG